MRDRAKTEKCTPEVQAFEECCKDSGIKMVITCRKQNNCLKACLGQWYKDEAFRTECTQIYLQKRAEYRKTGVKDSEKM